MNMRWICIFRRRPKNGCFTSVIDKVSTAPVVGQQVFIGALPQPLDHFSLSYHRSPMIGPLLLCHFLSAHHLQGPWSTPNLSKISPVFPTFNRDAGTKPVLRVNITAGWNPLAHPCLSTNTGCRVPSDEGNLFIWGMHNIFPSFIIKEGQYNVSQSNFLFTKHKENKKVALDILTYNYSKWIVRNRNTEIF